MIQTAWQWGQSDDHFAPNRILAYDSEFVRERHYYPKLSLVQIADQHGHARLYDAQDDRHAPPWAALFQHRAPIVMHAGSQDLELMQQYGQALPHSLRDTQIGFALLHPEPTVSFSALIDHYLGFAPNKSQTRSDWLQRPLSQAQLDYAANDVGLLLQVYPLMVAQLQRKGRLAWWAEECARLLADPPVGTPYAWYHLRLAPQLRGKAIVLADILTRAREQVAEQLDKPRRNILADKVLVDLACADIHSTQALAEWLPPEHLLWHALEFLEESFAQSTQYEPTPLPRAPRLTPRQQQFCLRLQRAIHKTATDLHIHAHTIISGKALRQWCSAGDYAQGLLRQGWRDECLKDIIDELAP